MRFNTFKHKFKATAHAREGLHIASHALFHLQPCNQINSLPGLSCILVIPVA